MKKVYINGFYIFCCFFIRMDALPCVYDRAVYAAQQNDWQTARDLLCTLLVENPSDARLAYDMGVASFKMGDIKQSIAYFENAASQASHDNALKERAYFNCGNAYAHDKQLQEALQAYEQALIINADNEQTKHNYEVVKKMLEQEQQQDQEQENQQDQQKKQDQQGQGQQDQQDQQNKQENQDTQNEDSDQDEKNQQDQQGNDARKDQKQDGDSNEDKQDQKNQEQKNGQNQQNNDNQQNNNDKYNKQQEQKSQNQQEQKEQQKEQRDTSEKESLTNENDNTKDQQGDANASHVGAQQHEELNNEENQWIVSLLEQQEHADNVINKKFLQARLKEGSNRVQGGHNW